MKTIAERLKRVKTVTLSYNLLAEYIYQSVNSFFKVNEVGFTRAAEKYQEDYYKHMTACWTAATLQVLQKDLWKHKKLFLRITKKNIKANFGEDK